MNYKRLAFVFVVTISYLVSLAISSAAQNQPDHQPKHHQYKAEVVGTLGGPNNNFIGEAGFGDFYAYASNYFNLMGATFGGAATNVPDPFSPNCFLADCFVYHATTYKDGKLTDLGALPGTGNGSFATGLNDFGLATGASENGLIDPATGYPEYHAVVWINGAIKDLGTFGGTVSSTIAVNEWGQVVGDAANAVPDQYASGLGPCTTWNCWTVSTQLRAYLWQGGKMQDLGTLGTGKDAAAYYVNFFGQIAGVSYTNTQPNPTTGIPTQHPFLWQYGKMLDLGTLGGSLATPYGLNDLGQVIVTSYLAGDQVYHAGIWDRGVLTDLGTLGGNLSQPLGLNETGTVVGISQPSNDQIGHAFVWKKGKMTNLRLLAGDAYSFAIGINDAGAIVGGSCNAQYFCRAFLSENGGAMVDLNALVNPASDLHLFYGYAINNGGKILVWGQLSNGDYRVGVLTPTGDCDGSCEQRVVESQMVPPGSESTSASRSFGFEPGSLWKIRSPFKTGIPSGVVH